MVFNVIFKEKEMVNTKSKVYSSYTVVNMNVDLGYFWQSTNKNTKML